MVMGMAHSRSALNAVKAALVLGLAGFLSLAAAHREAAAQAAAFSGPAPSFASRPASRFSVGEVVDRLISRNDERARKLLHSQATRVYHLTYRGIGGDREAEMTVEAGYDNPSTKTFRVVSQSGSKVILEHVFKKLLEGEREAAQPETNARTLMNRENYDFDLVGYNEAANEYQLAVTPKSKSKFVYRGNIWVDGTDFAITRIEAEPAQNPSFWTKKSEIQQRYMKVQDFWLPARNLSTSYIRLGGRAELTIDYKDYRLNGAEDSPLATRTEAEATQ
jgi:hypothetical protein